MKHPYQYGMILVAMLTALGQVPAATAGGDADGIVAVLAASTLILGQMNETSADSEADELAFVASIGYQHKRLQFEQKIRTFEAEARGTDAEFDVELPTINVGGTLAYQKMFMTLKYEKSIVDGSTEADETKQPDQLGYYFNIPDGSTKVDREDASITLGMNLISTLNIFVGYMKGKTLIRPDIGCLYDAFTAATCDEQVNPDGISNYSWVQKAYGGRGASGYEHEYTEEGPYVGFSYAWQIADAGTLSFSAAYADMDGEYKDNFFVPGFEFEYAGDSKGTSFGLTWTAPLGEASNYFFDIREQKYDMDAKDDNGHYPGGTVNSEETMSSLTAGIQFYF